jgi:hypothetical protein
VFHIDHIRPLANGGTNDNKETLEVLCKQCHQDKTETEIENGTYNKLRDSQSSFNKKVTKIMNSQSAKAFAFIENLNKAMYKKIFQLMLTNAELTYYIILSIIILFFLLWMMLLNILDKLAPVFTT